MKTRQAFFKDFFARLTETGFTVKELYENDIAAEVYAGPALFCAITQDGEIIYEDYNADQSRQLEQAAAETRTALDFCDEAPFRKLNQMETVSLARGAYNKVFESADAVMLCRFSELFGYEFVTCSKAADRHNKRAYYREMLFYDRQAAQDSFLQRGGFTLDGRSPVFTNQEYKLILECCTKRAMLDNDLDGGTESRINGIIQKIEAALPEQAELSPRQFFLDERN